jgi:hypothetical protein
MNKKTGTSNEKETKRRTKDEQSSDERRMKKQEGWRVGAME